MQWIAGANRNIASLLGAPCDRFIPPPNDRTTISLYNILKPTCLKSYDTINNGPEATRRHIIGLLYDFCVANPNFGNNAMQTTLIPREGNRDLFVNNYYNYLFTSPEAIDAPITLVLMGGEAINLYSMFRHENVPTHDLDTKMMAGAYFNNTTTIAAVPAAIKQRMHRYRFFVCFTLYYNLINLFTPAQIATGTPYLNQFPNVGGQTWSRIFGNPLAAGLSRVGICMPGAPVPAGAAPAIRHMHQDMIALLNQPYNPAAAPVYDINDDRYLETLIQIIVYVKLRPDAANHTRFPLVDLYIPRLINCNNNTRCLGHNADIHGFFATEQSISTTENGANPPIPNGLIPYIIKEYRIPPFYPDPISVRLVPNGYLIWDTLRMLLVSKALADNGVFPNKVLKYKQKLTCLLTALNMLGISDTILQTCDGSRSYPNDPKPYMLGGGIGNKIEEIFENFISTPIVNNDQPVKSSNTMQTLASSEPEYSEQFIREAHAFIRPMIEKGIPFEEVDTSTFTKPEHWAGYMDWMSYIEGGFSDYRLPPIEGDDLFSAPINIDVNIPAISPEFAEYLMPKIPKTSSSIRLGGRYRHRSTKKRSKAGKRVAATRKH
jgi:hypothetical protein